MYGERGKAVYCNYGERGKAVYCNYGECIVSVVSQFILIMVSVR